MINAQAAILADVPAHCRFIEFGLLPDANPAETLKALAGQPLPAGAVIGFGPGLVQRLGGAIEGLRSFPNLGGPGFTVPSTQADLWLWMAGEDPGEPLHNCRTLTALLAPSFRVDRVVDGFTYRDGRDLTGYVDGTENPEGDAAIAAALCASDAPGLKGSSFAAVQQWVHDLDHFDSLNQADRDTIIGRRIADNEEIEDAPESAHVKRTAQEDFEPEAFVLRRSMPWSDANGQGLMFVAFGNSLDAYEAQLRRMCGEEDGIVDGLFRFSRAISGSYFWCPPVAEGKLDLTALGI